MGQAGVDYAPGFVFSMLRLQYTMKQKRIEHTHTEKMSFEPGSDRLYCSSLSRIP